MENLEWPSSTWEDDDNEAIRDALDVSGYTWEMATPENLRTCFLDYAAAGYWQNLTLEDARDQIERGEITQEQMIRALKGGR